MVDARSVKQTGQPGSQGTTGDIHYIVYASQAQETQLQAVSQIAQPDGKASGSKCTDESSKSGVETKQQQQRGEGAATVWNAAPAPVRLDCLGELQGKIKTSKALLHTKAKLKVRTWNRSQLIQYRNRTGYLSGTKMGNRQTTKLLPPEIINEV